MSLRELPSTLPPRVELKIFLPPSPMWMHRRKPQTCRGMCSFPVAFAGRPMRKSSAPALVLRKVPSRPDAPLGEGRTRPVTRQPSSVSFERRRRRWCSTFRSRSLSFGCGVESVLEPKSERLIASLGVVLERQVSEASSTLLRPLSPTELPR